MDILMEEIGLGGVYMVVGAFLMGMLLYLLAYLTI